MSVADSVAQLFIAEAIKQVARASPPSAAGGDGEAAVAEAEREESQRMVVAAKIESMGQDLKSNLLGRYAPR